MWGYGPGVVRCGYLEEVTHYNSSNTSGVAVTVAEAVVLPLDLTVNWTFVGRTHHETAVRPSKARGHPDARRTRSRVSQKHYIFPLVSC